MTDPPGLDLARLAAYLDATAPGLLRPPLSGSLITGGKSNLTYLVGDGATTVVVRRPPLGHVLATAHDMAREHRVISALRDTDVPVPTALLLCVDESVIGAPFYVMERVPGTAYRSAGQLRALGPERTEVISRRCVQTLALVHGVDPGTVGLADFGRPEGFLERQVRRWGTQLDASRSRELKGAEELRAELAAALPPERRPAIVHGDYRLDNLLVDGRDEVTAVLDWEMATLGDPLTDLGLMMVYERVSRMGGEIADASTAPGYLSGTQALAAYAEVAGVDPEELREELGFYEALASFKLAVILEGIHYRHAQGQTTGEGFDAVGGVVEPLLAHGLAALG